MPLFGTEGIINHLTMIFGAVYALGGLIFRKSVANDLLNMEFSFIGSLSFSMITFIILDLIFNNIKILVVGSLIMWTIGGFLLAPIIKDGEASGGSD